jgi:3-hydroxybutyryl-CoA dehydrogenase
MDMKIEDIHCILIIGAGTMGQQISLQCAMHAYDVILYDIVPEALQSARAQINSYTAALVDQNRLSRNDADTLLGRIRDTSRPEDAAAADLVSESIPEDPDLKAKVFAQFHKICPPHAIFTTNTSTLIPSMYSAATGRPSQFAALHFHGLVWDSNVVDIMPHPGTSPETVELLLAFARQIGQIPILLHKESYQYVFNAMLGALNTAALKLVTDGVAVVEDIDRAWMGVMKTPIGPFGIMDFVGLKTVWDITQYWATVTGDIQLQANANFLKPFVDKEQLGVKTGKGFYSYPDPAYARPDFLTGRVDHP